VTTDHAEPRPPAEQEQAPGVEADAPIAPFASSIRIDSMDDQRNILYREGSSKRGFREFPLPVEKDLGVALFVVHWGRTPDCATP
jgi:hypothetical protein